ncbi:MAG: hypothetical protein IJ785_03530 [Bacteroidales bacterium]|nr:hypothetical protein [Bacteroidales bacterium]
MKPNSINESDIEQMLMRHTRRQVEQQLLAEVNEEYGRTARRADLRHYAVTLFAAVLLVGVFWQSAPPAMAQATSEASFAQRHDAMATADLII